MDIIKKYKRKNKSGSKKITTRCILYNLVGEHYSTISYMCEMFCKAVHYSYNRIYDNRDNKDFEPTDLKGIVAEKYNLNSRQAADAIEEARQTYVSQKELLDTYIEEYESKVEGALRKLERTTNASKRKPLISKLDKRLRILCKYLNHKKNNTLPPVIFGGKQNFYDRCKGAISKGQYFKNRYNRFVSRGDKTKNGNPNLRIIIKDKETFLEITTLEYTLPKPRLKSDGTMTKPNPRYKKILIPIYIPQKLSKKTKKVNGFDYKSALLSKVIMEEAYKVEILMKDNKIYAHVTFDLDKTEVVHTGHNLTLGIDTNPDGLALTLIDNKGNYKWHTYLKESRLLTARSNLRANLCGNLVKQVILIAKTYGCAIAIEDLEFKNSRDVKSKLYRTISQFCYSLILKMIEAACFREGIEIVKVKPHYTSKIGLYKYCNQYGMDVHNGAAMVIARRSYKFKERIPKLYRSFFKEKLHSVNGNTGAVYKYGNLYDNWRNVSDKIYSISKNRKPSFFIENRKGLKDMILA